VGRQEARSDQLPGRGRVHPPSVPQGLELVVDTLMRRSRTINALSLDGRGLR
jgi:hypothetical protein